MNRDDYILCLFIIAFVIIVAIGIAFQFRAKAASAPAINSVVADTPEIEPKQLKCYTIYDVPLNDEMQIFTQAVCTEYGVPFKLILGIMWRESTFDANAVSDKDCIGLMQVNPINGDDLLAECDIYDLYEPCQNIRAGIHIFADFYRKYSVVKALMCYRNGERGAKGAWKKGIESYDYTDDIIAYAANLKIKNRIYEEATL